MQIYSARKVFTGTEFLNDHAIVLEDDILTRLIPIAHLEKKSTVHAEYIVPAFIDLQIYGASGKLFSEHPTVESLSLLYDHCKAGGTAYFLPTVATNTLDVIQRSIDAIKQYWQAQGRGVIGLHLEGPWINPQNRGAHLEKLIHPPTLNEVKDILEYGKGVIKIITLAPEVCNAEIFQLIRSYDVVISAGHSNSTYSEAITSFNQGITTVTHLFNAMSSFHHRDTGLPGATLNHDNVKASIIADGHHVSYPAISLAQKIMRDRLFLITDAVTDTATGPYQHKLEKDKYTAEDILSGSALTMLQAVKNCIQLAGIDIVDALKMASFIPAQMMNMDAGILTQGKRAHFIMLNERMQVIN